MTDILIPLAGITVPFAALAAIIIVPRWLKSRDRQELQATVRAAIDKGQPLPPEMIEAIGRDVKAPSSRLRDWRTAVIWLALAGALVTIGMIHGYYEGFDESAPAFGFATIPGFIGIAYVILGFLNKNR